MKKLFYALMFFCPFVAYAQQNGYKSSVDYMWMNVGNAGFSAGESDYTSLSFSPSGEPYVIFQDWANSKKATVMKFNGTNWVVVGSEGFSSSLISEPSLAFSQNGQPYVAYSVESVSIFYHSFVKKFDGMNWVNVGNNVDFFYGQLYSNSLAFSPSGEPYIALEDSASGSQPRVIRFEGTNWLDVGTTGFTGEYGQLIHLAFSPSGQPHVVYQNPWGSGSGVSVMKFDGTNWLDVGAKGIIGGGITSLAISPSGEPYVAYIDPSNYDFVSVVKYNGTSWNNVGVQGFSNAKTACISLAFSPSGEPYVAFNDEQYGYKATVMKYDGTSWVYHGSRGFSAGVSKGESLAFSISGATYVAYSDAANSKKATVMKFDSVFVGINDNMESTILISPNPATSEIRIETSTTPTKSQLSIMNVNGQQLIARQITESKTQLDITNLTNGVYFVRLINNRNVTVGKFIKN